MRIPVKLAIIAALMLLLVIPLLLVVSKIYERDNYHEQARNDIANSWTGDQLILGPILVVPYTRIYENREFNKELERYVTSKARVDEQLFVLPDTLNGDVDLQTEIRYRGIYEVPVYSSAIRLGGEISNREILELAQREDVIEVGQPYLSVVVNDMRGITASPALNWNGDTVNLLPGSQLAFRNAGMHAPLRDIDRAALSRYRFSVSFSLRGMSLFRFVPVGNSSAIDIASSWPHPRFEGLYLPSHREISDSGFSASWQTSAFATNIAEKARDCASGNCSQLMNNSLGAVLIDPVDVYLQAQRASKYGILFIGLTFTAFFLYEVLRKIAIHPIQYTLVGLALSVFYLLLVSLAEHISFLWAYGIATLACSGLLGFYITYVLKSLRRGSLFAAAIIGLYAILYVIIQEEDYAFSMGAGLIFIALSGVMFATRNIDWFQVSKYKFQNAEAEAGKT
jgi:inner membrane protein